jgi:hypothetical protein
MDFGDMEAEEVAGFGLLLHRLVPAVKTASEASASKQPPLTASLSDAEGMAKKIQTELESP